jgi:hypothetical protein
MDAAMIAGIDDNLSARLIAEKLGVTRNAVLGRKFRLGWAKPSPKKRRLRGIDGLRALGLAARACGFTVAELEALRKDLEEDRL